MSTYAAAIATARTVLNDTDSSGYTWTDADLLAYANDALAAASILRPDLFETVSTFTCAEGAIQQLPATVLRVSEVFCVVGGTTVTEVPRETLDRFSPTWMSEDADGDVPPVNWARHPRSNRTFFVHPPAAAGTVLRMQWVAPPTRESNSNTEMPLPDSYFPAVVDYIVGRAEMRDDEHANDNRAKQMMESFAALLGVGLQAKTAIDREDGAIAGSGKVSPNG